MTSYDLAKDDQLDTDMMLLNFRTFNAQAMIDCQSLKPEPMIPFEPVKARKVMSLN